MKNPSSLFLEWYKDHLKNSRQHEPTHMILATATKEGIPSARAVLLKSHSDKGFIFYTNYESRKGHELEENPNAAICFYWDEIRKQVRITGRVKKISAQESDQYFSNRDRRSQLGAWTSKQSTELSDFNDLQREFSETELNFQNTKQIPRPEYWGGYILIPNEYEFWINGESRLHERFIYKNISGEWVKNHLYP